jgi:hypothetical protein
MLLMLGVFSIGFAAGVGVAIKVVPIIKDKIEKVRVAIEAMKE